MNSFNKTGAAVYPMQALLPLDFLFFQINAFLIIGTQAALK